MCYRREISWNAVKRKMLKTSVFMRILELRVKLHNSLRNNTSLVIPTSRLAWGVWVEIYYLFRDGELKTTGVGIDNLLPPMRRFGGDSNRAEKKQTVIEKLKAFFEKYFGVV